LAGDILFFLQLQSLFSPAAFLLHISFCPGEGGAPSMVPTAYYLILAAALFSIGIAAFLIKRNVITIFISIELMLNAVNLTFVAFAHMWHQVSGQIFVFFVMVVAAAEAAVGLAIIISLFRTRRTLNVDSIDLMKS
jgi:NADH-quinone oxidoreductase subunit K